MRNAVEKHKAVTLGSKPITTVLAHFPTQTVLYPEAAGKTHLEVSQKDLQSGLFDDAIRKEFDAFVKWGVFGPQMSAEEAKAKGYQLVTFRGVASWKLKDGKRIPKWRGVCRGFEDHWQGDVDTDAPSFTTIKTLFLYCYSRGLTAAYTDGTTAFLQVPCPPDRKVAVVLSGYIPSGLPFKPRGVYPLRKM